MPEILPTNYLNEKIMVWLATKGIKNKSRIYTLKEIKSLVNHHGKDSTLRDILKQFCKSGFCTEIKTKKRLGRPRGKFKHRSV